MFGFRQITNENRPCSFLKKCLGRVVFLKRCDLAVRRAWATGKPMLKMMIAPATAESMSRSCERPTFKAQGHMHSQNDSEMKGRS